MTGCFDKMIRVWDMTDGKVVDWFQANDMITAMCFHPESTHLVVGYFKGFVKIYRADEVIFPCKTLESDEIIPGKTEIRDGD